MFRLRREFLSELEPTIVASIHENGRICIGGWTISRAVVCAGSGSEKTSGCVRIDLIDLSILQSCIAEGNVTLEYRFSMSQSEALEYNVMSIQMYT